MGHTGLLYRQGTPVLRVVFNPEDWGGHGLEAEKRRLQVPPAPTVAGCWGRVVSLPQPIWEFTGPGKPIFHSREAVLDSDSG
jgi:hypothetical protein